MAKELLVTDALSDKMIQAGAKLVERLDEDASNIKSALWLYFPDARNWKLILASEIVETDGPRKLYEKIQGQTETRLSPRMSFRLTTSA